MLLRDVTELRRRERELITKDATIREIHHRVKNNLQTVAALLRLQARRMDSDQGREALEEAVRRVGSIAIVHETLSQNLDERVEFDEIADRVLAMVAEISPGKVTGRRTGRFGILDAEVATPLSMVLTEVLQNALEHGFGPGEQGTVEVAAVRGGTGEEARLLVTVQDDGRGLPEGFDPQRAGNLGLQIVRTLVEGELGGTFDMVPAPEPRHAGRPRHPVTRREALSAGPPRGRRPASPGPGGTVREPRLLGAMRTGATARCGSRLARCAHAVLRAAARAVSGVRVRRWRCGPGCGRRGASSRGARPR